MTTSHTRAAILERTLSKFAAAGIPIDADPILRDWLQIWVDGGLKMSDIAQRYQDLLKGRLMSKTDTIVEAADMQLFGQAEHHKIMDQHQLLEEVARLLAEESP